MVRFNRDKQSPAAWLETNTVDMIAGLNVTNDFERIHIDYVHIIALTVPHIEPQVALCGTVYRA
jgi:hypothetical protein